MDERVIALGRLTTLMVVRLSVDSHKMSKGPLSMKMT